MPRSPRPQAPPATPSTLAEVAAEVGRDRLHLLGWIKRFEEYIETKSKSLRDEQDIGSNPTSGSFGKALKSSFGRYGTFPNCPANHRGPGASCMCGCALRQEDSSTRKGGRRTCGGDSRPAICRHGPYGRQVRGEVESRRESSSKAVFAPDTALAERCRPSLRLAEPRADGCLIGNSRFGSGM
jgi:hypothetical protein